MPGEQIARYQEQELPKHAFSRLVLDRPLRALKRANLYSGAVVALETGDGDPEYGPGRAGTVDQDAEQHSRRQVRSTNGDPRTYSGKRLSQTPVQDLFRDGNLWSVSSSYEPFMQLQHKKMFFSRHGDLMR